MGPWLRTEAPESSGFCLKPVHGYQNKNTFVVQGENELLRRKPWDVQTAIELVEADHTFDGYVAEELVNCEHGATLPVDYKFFCFGAHVAHVYIVTGRHRKDAGSYGYGVNYADCDADYAEAPTWCSATADAETGSTRGALPPRPACWDEMVGTVRRLGAAAGCFGRIDMYATVDRGAVFGEYQFLFDLRDWNSTCDENIRRHWRGWDGGDQQ